MSLSLENNKIAWGLRSSISGGGTEALKGLARKPSRGLRAWQMYVWVPWELGRALSSFHQRAGQGLTGTEIKAWRPVSGSSSLTSIDHETEEQGKVSGSDQKPMKRETGSLSTLILLIESRVTDPREPVSKKGVCRVMDSLLRNTHYTR